MLSIKKLLIIIAIAFSSISNTYADNILIIGGSAGIGRALVEVYSQTDYNVYATFNQNVPIKYASNKVNYIKLDVTDQTSLDNFLQDIKGLKFNIIIYNAGKFGYKSNKGPILDRKDWINSFIINTIAPIELAFALQSSFIDKHGKYIAITSRRGSNTINISDKYNSRYSYRSSKAALNSALIALSMDFKEKNITVLMLHPGQVKTKMTKYKGIEPEKSAQLIKNTIDNRSFIDTGKFIDVQSNTEMPW